jgi:carboxymethylenebutenolidase
MAISTETVVKPDGFTGYLARPARAGGPLPGVLVVHEAWGVDAHIEDVTRRIAAAGYLALAPDLFTETAERPEPLSRDRMEDLQAFLDEGPPDILSDEAARESALSRRPEPERGRLATSLAALSRKAFAPEQRGHLLSTLQAAVQYLREEQLETRGQRVAVVGFCLGGTLAAHLACRDAALAAAAIFYGGPPPSEEIPNIGCPVAGFYGARDARVTGQVPAFTEAMRAAGKRFEPRIYPGAGHAFFNDGRPSYDVTAARDAFPRLLAFLRDTLT